MSIDQSSCPAAAIQPKGNMTTFAFCILIAVVAGLTRISIAS